MGWGSVTGSESRDNSLVSGEWSVGFRDEGCGRKLLWVYGLAVGFSG